MGVDVEGERNRRVAEALADDLRVDAGRQRERGVGMPEVVIVPMSAQT
jgi:hypothetical protein